MRQESLKGTETYLYRASPGKFKIIVGKWMLWSGGMGVMSCQTMNPEVLLPMGFEDAFPRKIQNAPHRAVQEGYHPKEHVRGSSSECTQEKVSGSFIPTQQGKRRVAEEISGKIRSGSVRDRKCKREAIIAAFITTFRMANCPLTSEARLTSYADMMDMAEVTPWPKKRKLPQEVTSYMAVAQRIQNQGPDQDARYQR
ncbi:hypothetical protein LWI29_020636 [Acer saccharum]|uniref:Uncharacterized protein n=1 Tax=Acer saccharum TaxID=4024 RepID=A0AA39SRN8_ACESA|nr:hypothetical protein LWI29_020636 [Acer saccharum]